MRDTLISCMLLNSLGSLTMPKIAISDILPFLPLNVCGKKEYAVYELDRLRGGGHASGLMKEGRIFAAE